MGEETQRRLANNEAAFREVNEAIEAGLWPGERDAPVAFRCECAQLGCTMLIGMRLDDYERVRENSSWFIVAVGHEIPELETVVRSPGGYLVVEKRGEAGRVAAATDPRD